MKSLIVKKNDISKNVEIIKNTVDSRIIAVVKSDGYGLSVIPLCQELVKLGIDFFAVTELSDAIKIRNNITENVDILCLCGILNENQADDVVNNSITAMVYDNNIANLLSFSAKKLNQTALAHIKINTGLNRYGFTSSLQVNDVLTTENINFSGIFTHLHSALDRKKVDVQIDFFNKLLSEITEHTFDLIHVCNSYATMNYSDLHFSAVRVGSAILGRVSGDYSFSKVGFLESSIYSINPLKKGDSVGYRAGFRAKTDMKTAVIDAGSFDGFDLVKNEDIFTFSEVLKSVYRKLKTIGKSNFVTINDKKCRVLGKISMNSAVVDVTHLDCIIGERVEIPVNPLYVHQSIERKYI